LSEKQKDKITLLLETIIQRLEHIHEALEDINYTLIDLARGKDYE